MAKASVRPRQILIRPKWAFLQVKHAFEVNRTLDETVGVSLREEHEYVSIYMFHLLN